MLFLRGTNATNDLTNKHLLPVYDEPMICKSISVIKDRIKDIMVVLGGYSGNEFFHLLGDGHRMGLEIRYAYQEQAELQRHEVDMSFAK